MKRLWWEARVWLHDLFVGLAVAVAPEDYHFPEGKLERLLREGQDKFQ